MQDFLIPTWLLLSTILVLTFVSAFFAGSETAMMKLNPYRLKHKVEEKHRGARKTNRLLRRQDRLLGVILIINNLVNNCAALVAGVICVRWFGEPGYAVAAIGLTIYFLIFAEVAPKTIAAERPESIAFPASYVLGPLLQLLQPLVKLINFCSTIVVVPFIKRTRDPGEELSIDELRTVVVSRANIPTEHQGMLLGILDLENTTVEDIMISRSDIVGLDMNDTDEEIIDLLVSSSHTRLPVYVDNVNQVKGVLHLKRAGRFLSRDEFDKAEIERAMEAPSFVPNATPLPTQLLNFKKNKGRIALVVDEYGDVVGIVTLEDILEEIVGEFTTSTADINLDVHVQDDGSYLVSGHVLIRDVNQQCGWDLPIAGPRTLNGLILEQLGEFPDGVVGVRIGSYEFEATKLSDKAIQTVRIKRWLAKADERAASSDEEDDIEDLI